MLNPESEKIIFSFFPAIFFVLIPVFISVGLCSEPGSQDHQTDLASDSAWRISVDDGPWRKIKVPGGGYNSDKQDKPWIDGGTVKDHVVYKRFIDIPKVYEGQVSKIEFGGVNHGCNIYINDKLISSHVGPMMPFAVDVSNIAVPGESYELKVECFPQWHYDYSVPHGFIYEESYKTDKQIPKWAGGEPGWVTKFSYGITKYARLAVYPQVYIKDVFVRPSVGSKSLSFDVWVDNHSDEEKSVILESGVSSWNNDNWKYPRIQDVEIFVGGGKVTKVTVGPVEWEPGSESYWWPNKPFQEDYTAKLHNLNLTLKDRGAVLDRKIRRFGFVEWTEGPYYYMVNGVRINQISDGTPEAAMSEYDCYSSSAAFLPPTGPKTGCPETWKKFMRLGICANRLHQSTPTEYMMNTADELGFMLIAETPIRGCQEQKWTNIENFTGSVKEMALYGRNHPSICRYSLLNEGATEHVPELIDAIVTVDDTRPLVFEDNQLKKLGRIDGKNGHAYIMLHYVDYPKPAKVITGMGEFAWRWVMHKEYSPNILHADGGLEEFIYYGGDMRRWDIVYIAGWAFINYWPNFLEGMSFEKHAWKQSCYPKDRKNGVDGWDSAVVERAKKYFHPYLVLDAGIHEVNKFDPSSREWIKQIFSYSAGELIERKLEVFNDGLEGNDFTIKWRACWDHSDGEQVNSGVIENLTIKPGFHESILVSFKAPETKADRRKLYFVVESELFNNVVFSEKQIYFLINSKL